MGSPTRPSGTGQAPGRKASFPGPQEVGQSLPAIGDIPAPVPPGPPTPTYPLHPIGSSLPVLWDSVSSPGCVGGIWGRWQRCITGCPPPLAIPGAGTSLQTCSSSPVRPGDTVTARHSASGIHRAPVPAMAAATAVATAAARPVQAPAPRPRPRQRPGLRAPAATCPRPRERHPATGIGTGRGTPRERHRASPPRTGTGNGTPGNGTRHRPREREPQSASSSGTLAMRMAPGMGIENVIDGNGTPHRYREYRHGNGSPRNGTPKVTPGNGTKNRTPGMASRDWCRALVLGRLSMRKAPGTPSSLGVYPRKRNWECNAQKVFPGTASGIYPWERNWECYSRNSTAGHHAPGNSPSSRPPGWGRTGTWRGGGHEPPTPQSHLHPTGDCVPCPGHVLTELGQPHCTGDRTGDIYGCIFWTWGTRGTQEHQEHWVES